MKGYFCSRTFTHRVDELNAKLAYSMYAQIVLRVAFREVMIIMSHVFADFSAFRRFRLGSYFCEYLLPSL